MNSINGKDKLANLGFEPTVFWPRGGKALISCLVLGGRASQHRGSEVACRGRGLVEQAAAQLAENM
jgi:hypothetical protein